MENSKNQVLKEWLDIDLSFIANKLSFIRSEYTVSEELIYQSIRCLDYETTVSKTPSVNYVITLTALMWEYTDRKKYDLKKIIVKFLSRIGYPTSAIIADTAFDIKKCVFSSLESPIDHILTTLNQTNNSVSVKDNCYLLTNFQKKIWDGMDNERLIGISAPTSAGKSFVILLKILSKLCIESFDVVYIVPTLSLLNQVSEDFNKTIQQLHISNCMVSNSYVERNTSSVNTIYVLTQEKAITAFSDERNSFKKDIILVADEIQNIERIKEDDDERAKILFDTLNEFRYKNNVKQIIISGPRIEDIETTGTNIFGCKAKNITSHDAPVLNLTYSICKENTTYYLKQYCALTNSPIKKRITNPQMIQGYGKKIYDDKFLCYLSSIISSLMPQQNIIFSPTSSTARKIACSINGEPNNNKKLTELIAYYQSTIHPQFSMCETLAKGIAYHHGKLPHHVRRTIEIAIHNKLVSTIACTTTLLQGVNLPTQNIIIRNPHLYVKKRANSVELSNYEMANLRGRAGRLLKDFIGRTFVLDESAFTNSEEYDKSHLFEDATKELPTSYRERFDKYYSDIEQVISSDRPVNIDMMKYGDLISYIRQSVLRYGEKSKQKMQDVGINLTKEQIDTIISELEKITVPKNICFKNRYWDPFVLDVIYKKFKKKVPKHPFEQGARDKLEQMLNFLRDTPETSHMYNKYISSQLQKGNGGSFLCSLCMIWAKGDSLKSILANKNYSNKDNIADKIETIIEILQNTVSYKVPLLLKPLFDIKDSDSSFISCIQAGAYNPITRMMIDMGVPRECALELTKSLFRNYDYNLNSTIKYD